MLLRRMRLNEGLWADFGTGSGALAIGIARILGNCGRVIATDLSPVATAIASYNVQRYDLETNGEEQSKFLVNYIETKKQGSFSEVKMVPDFAGIQRFITGFRGRRYVTERAKDIILGEGCSWKV